MMKDICKKINLPEKDLAFLDYFRRNEQINKMQKKRHLKEEMRVRFAILASSSINGINEVLNVKCAEAGIRLDFYSCDYNQYIQDIINTKSRLYQFKPNITVLFIDTKTFLGDYFYFPYSFSRHQRQGLIKNKINEFAGLIKKIIKNIDTTLIVHNFEVPSYSPLGILETKQKFGYFDSIRYINRALQDLFHKTPNVFIFDYDSFLSSAGKGNSLDRKMYYIADMKLHQNLIPALCRQYLRYIKAIKSINRKCIVLDLDDTLWGGVLGEDELEGIRLGLNPPGNAYVEFQKYLLALFERGVILAINSANNHDEAMRVIREHPHMVLREDNFAAIKINWKNKVNNILEIAKEINIGLDHLIYIDDSQQNRQLVRQMLPDVLVVQMPKDPSDYIRAIEELDEFDWLNITEEDKLRGVMYAQEIRRKQFKANFKDMAKYLEGLQTKVTIKRADRFSIPRISQLTYRTNQFNFTTYRYSERQIINLLKDNRYNIYSVSVSDKFGDNGISGAVILREDRKIFSVDTFLLSCRILGRGVERAVLTFILDEAKKSGAEFLLCQYIPTQKNEMIEDFLRENKFVLEGESEGRQNWKFYLKKRFVVQKSLTIIK